MGLVEYRARPIDIGLCIIAPVIGFWVNDAALGHEGGAVGVVEGEVLFFGIGIVAEERRVPLHCADDLAGIGIEQEFCRVEAVTMFGFERAMDAIAIAGAGAKAGHIAVPDFIGIFGEIGATDLGFSGL